MGDSTTTVFRISVTLRHATVAFAPESPWPLFSLPAYPSPFPASTTCRGFHLCVFMAGGRFQWGHDFRPEYCKLGILKRQFAHVPVLAVTATCTDFIRDDVSGRNGAVAHTVGARAGVGH